MSLGVKIKELRLERGWTQDNLKTEAGIHKTTLVNIETGRTKNPDRKTLHALARALEVKPEELLSLPGKGDDEMGRSIKGLPHLPVGHNPQGMHEFDTLDLLHYLLGRVCVLEKEGKATQEEREALTNLASRLEGQHE